MIIFSVCWRGLSLCLPALFSSSIGTSNRWCFRSNPAPKKNTGDRSSSVLPEPNSSFHARQILCRHPQWCCVSLPINAQSDDDRRHHYLVVSLALQGICQTVLSFAFHQRQYRPVVFTADDQTSFQISIIALQVLTDEAFVDAHEVRKDSTMYLFATESTTSLQGLAQVKERVPPWS